MQCNMNTSHDVNSDAMMYVDASSKWIHVDNTYKKEQPCDFV